MSDDSSGGFQVRGARGESEDSDDFEIGSAFATRSAPKRRRGPGRILPRLPHVASTTPALVFIVVDSNIASTEFLQTKLARTQNSLPHFDGDLLCIVAVAFVHWKLRHTNEAADDDIWMRSPA